MGSPPAAHPTRFDPRNLSASNITLQARNKNNRKEANRTTYIQHKERQEICQQSYTHIPLDFVQIDANTRSTKNLTP
jgi:hypothetical protein